LKKCLTALALFFFGFYQVPTLALSALEKTVLLNQVAEGNTEILSLLFFDGQSLDEADNQSVENGIIEVGGRLCQDDGDCKEFQSCSRGGVCFFKEGHRHDYNYWHNDSYRRRWDRQNDRAFKRIMRSWPDN